MSSSTVWTEVISPFPHELFTFAKKYQKLVKGAGPFHFHRAMLLKV